jgi:YHS domain-containing protein
MKYWISIIVTMLTVSLGCKKQEDVQKEYSMEGMHHEETMHMQDGEESAMQKETGVVIREANKDEAGVPTQCPVMGTKFKVEEGSIAADYNGKTYYLCCPGCVEPFKNDPEKYLNK